MSEIFVKDYTEVKADRGEEAAKLHAQIMANGSVAASALLEFCKGLKRMRDEKLYTELGFDSFEGYTEKLAGIKARMAYHYIACYENLGSGFLQSNAGLGVTKLTMLTKLSPADRLELAESGELESISVRELEEKIKELTGENEQLSLMASTERDKAASSAQRLEELVQKSKREIEELKNRLELAESGSDEKIEAIRREMRDEQERLAKAKYEKELNENSRKAAAEAEKAKSEKESAVKEAERETEKRLSIEFEKKLAELTDEKEKYERELATLKKRQGVEGDKRTAEFQFHFRTAQSEIKSMLAIIEKMSADNGEAAAKLSQALKKYFEIAVSNI